MRLQTDYLGKRLCDHCWDGNHYYRWVEAREVGRTEPKKEITKSGKGAGVHSNCQLNGCECDCVALMQEKRPRIVKDKSSQIEIDTPDVLLFEAGKAEPSLRPARVLRGRSEL